MFELISKLSFTKGFNILLILFGCISGPFCFLYRYYYPLYSQNSLSKVLLLSAAIGVPVCLAMSFLNALMIGAPSLKDQQLKEEWELKIIGFTSGICGFVFYIACFADWFFWGLRAKDGIELMLYAYAGAVAYSIYYTVKSKRKKGKLK